MSAFISKLDSRTSYLPKKAMILAAGEARRMRPVTDNLPKPLIEVGGKAILDRSIDALNEIGITEITVNARYLGEQIASHLEGRDGISVSLENEPLETGGGVANALPHLGAEPFFVINGDSVWLDGMKSTLVRVAESWDPERMDILLLLQPLARMIGDHGLGDYQMEPDGKLIRRPEQIVAPFAYMGVSIINPAIFEKTEQSGEFSMLKLFDEAQERSRLYGLVHDGLWYHISTPADLAIAQQQFSNGHIPAVPYF